MNFNIDDMAQQFANYGNTPTANSAGGARGNSSGGADRNNNGVPDREEMTLKVSRPAQQQRTNGMPPANANSPVGNLIPQGVDLRNLGQFLRTPAGRDSLRQVIDGIVRRTRQPSTQGGPQAPTASIQPYGRPRVQ